LGRPTQHENRRDFEAAPEGLQDNPDADTKPCEHIDQRVGAGHLRHMIAHTEEGDVARIIRFVGSW